METVARIYPENALAGRDDLDVIEPRIAPTLDAQFAERVRRSAADTACIEYDEASRQWRHFSWREMAGQVRRWQAAFEREGLSKGDRVALRLRNGRHWVCFDQAALGLGLVVVPLYAADRPDNVNYVLAHSDAVLLLVADNRAWNELREAQGDTPDVRRVLVLSGEADGDRVTPVAQWLDDERETLASGVTAPDDLASIVYTSGTTGPPKGVMLSHRNMVSNAYSGLRAVAITPRDTMFSLLPLSHTLERTVGYYVPVMAGARIVYNRSLKQLTRDLAEQRPSGMIAVPKVFERSHAMIQEQLAEGPALRRWLFELTVRVGWKRFCYRQGRAPWDLSLLLWPLLDRLVATRLRARLGGRLTLAVVGGAPCPPAVSKVFLAMGITILQGYGLTETSPSISINTRRHNRPDTVGLPLPDVEVRIGENRELLARGPNIMLGYWKDEEATRRALDDDGWLHSGDQAQIEDGFIRITGRLKDILVLTNGEKIAPADMEAAIVDDPLFEQVMVVGEGRPYLSALVVLEAERWRQAAGQLGVAADDAAVLQGEAVQSFLCERIAGLVREFPGYATIQRVTATLEPWTVEDGLLTPTLKVKRPKVLDAYAEQIERMYA